MKLVLNRVGSKDVIDLSDDVVAVELIASDGTTFSFQPKDEPYLELIMYSRKAGSVLMIQPRSANSVRLLAEQ